MQRHQIIGLYGGDGVRMPGTIRELDQIRSRHEFFDDSTHLAPDQPVLRDVANDGNSGEEFQLWHGFPTVSQAEAGWEPRVSFGSQELGARAGMARSAIRTGIPSTTG